MEPVRVGAVSIGGAAPLALIAGPCVIESRTHALMMAERVAEIAAAHSVPFVFKASFDKANRSSQESYRGPGLREGLDILHDIRTRTGLPVCSDIHLPEQAAPAAEVLDLIQIPAFLCRQTDLLQAAGATAKPVNIKKGQFMAPEDMRYAAEKAREAGAGGVMLTERGSSFGYRRLVADMSGLPVMRALGCPVVFDATHSVQQPGGLEGKSGGERTLAPVLARAAVAAGVDALFVEVHDAPERALSDGPNMLDLAMLDTLLGEVRAIERALRDLR